MKIRPVVALWSVALLTLGASSLAAQAPARIVVGEDRITLQPGESGQITASVVDADGNPVDAPIMYMARGARGRLDVNRTSGAVQAVYGGEYLVTLMVATDRNIRAEMTVAVPYPELDRVDISPGESGRFYVGSVMRHRATVYDAVEDVRGDVELGWSTSDESVATVDRFGVFSAHAPGQVTLTAAADGVAGEVVYDVVASPVTSISLSGSQEVGRTGDVSGTLEIADEHVTSAEIAVDLTTLQTDDRRRDSAVQRALGTSQHQTATFVLTGELHIEGAVESGEPVSFAAPGDLTVNGITQPVVVDIEAQLVGSVIAVVGSVEITFADFDVTVPQVPVVLSAEDHGIIEFQLLFRRA